MGGRFWKFGGSELENPSFLGAMLVSGRATVKVRSPKNLQENPMWNIDSLMHELVCREESVGWKIQVTLFLKTAWNQALKRHENLSSFKSGQLSSNKRLIISTRTSGSLCVNMNLYEAVINPLLHHRKVRILKNVGWYNWNVSDAKEKEFKTFSASKNECGMVFGRLCKHNPRIFLKKIVKFITATRWYTYQGRWTWGNTTTTKPHWTLYPLFVYILTWRHPKQSLA